MWRTTYYGSRFQHCQGRSFIIPILLDGEGDIRHSVHHRDTSGDVRERSLFKGSPARPFISYAEEEPATSCTRDASTLAVGRSTRWHHLPFGLFLSQVFFFFFGIFPAAAPKVIFILNVRASCSAYKRAPAGPDRCTVSSSISTTR